MQLKVRACLEDVRLAAELILRFTANKSLSDYENDVLLRSAVERQFEIIGEAINRMRRVDPNIIDSLPQSLRIIAFRNILIHGYDVVENTIVWEVVQNNLSPLLRHVQGLLSTQE